LAYEITTAQKVRLAVAASDAAGNDCPVPTPVTWTSSNVAVATVSSEGSTAVVAPVAPGACQIDVTSTNADGTLLHTSFDISVVPAPAAHLIVDAVEIVQ
jgi:uncharacterized protein YjdB